MLAHGNDQIDVNSQALAELVQAMFAQSQAEIIAEEGPLEVLALPLEPAESQRWLAVAALVGRVCADEHDLKSAARLLGRTPEQTAEWLAGKPCWPAEAALRAARMAGVAMRAEGRIGGLEHEVEKVSDNLATTYEEISLLYGVTQNLQISSSDEELGNLALDWLKEVLPAETVAIQFLPPSDAENMNAAPARFLSCGAEVLSSNQFSLLAGEATRRVKNWPLVLNEPVTTAPDWEFPQVRQLILLPLTSGKRNFGWLTAINHEDGLEFGTVEASLLRSVGAILSIHCGNLALYREQGEFLKGMVRALTSAIDAKDPYTSGHSDRVARISVMLGREMGLDSEALNKIYLGGLLHDVGKIGIDDNVLRKPGRLTDAEYEHIKLHPQLGYNILSDLKQVSDVLPIVLHHHEQWDGGGYPAGLKGEETPLMARIASVADAYDAMTSDRPYRRGMPVEKVETIFREGSGSQWDAEVIEAYFRCRERITKICNSERAGLTLDVDQWM